jgi:hypothetical protein
VVSEFIKQRYNAGKPAALYFWRDNVGHEIDLLYETPEGLQAVEIKSGATFASDWLQGPEKWLSFAGNDALPPLLVFGGTGEWQRGSVQGGGLAGAGINSYGPAHWHTVMQNQHDQRGQSESSMLLKGENHGK